MPSMWITILAWVPFPALKPENKTQVNKAYGHRNSTLEFCSRQRCLQEDGRRFIYLLLLEAALPLVSPRGAGLSEPFLDSGALSGCEVNIVLFFLLCGSLLWTR